ncbi:major facilitator superfamily permease [Zafaria cholistanensis]|uniref:Major facilitator superfamily permease n=1 Tax=Zafaria cholistanensis TaxID=1682741 RepID=A0A5A7NRG7_9MICC|nr:MFS transporter [Zafaria cholistanensis]GER23400.1 major facilitator superfamily permease [Zafaria cholistanensis]
MTIRERIDASPMSPYQWLIIGLCTLLNALDGFDVLAMAFTANRVSADFALSGAQLGMLLSSGLLGMAAGSLLLAPFADAIGRRPMTILSSGLAAAGMLLSATAHSAAELGGWRFLTGLGVGGILACTNVIASEYSSKRWRGMSVAIYTAGYGLGATLGGMAAVGLQASFGWRSVFLFGGAITAAVCLLLVALLPESVDFLVSRRPAGALERLNRISRRIGQPVSAELPAGTAAAAGSRTAVRNQIATLFSARHRRVTVLVWAAFFTTMFGFYFANSWTPKLLVAAGMTESQGVVGGLMLTLGGTFGSLLFGALSTKWNARAVLLWFTVLSAVAMVVFISTASFMAVAFAAGVVVGMLINGCIAGLYTISPASYEAPIRSTGVGWALGVGRLGAIIAPLATGALLDASWTPVQLYLGVGAVLLVAAAAVWFLGGTSRTAAPADATQAGDAGADDAGAQGPTVGAGAAHRH